MMAEYTLHFLGPTGTFTHQAAIEAAKMIRPSARAGAMPPFHGRPSAAAAAGIVEWCRLPRP